MPRLTTDQWAAIRLEWEGEPTATFGQLGEKHGVDKASISRAAKREGWAKTGQLDGINESAQRKADARCDSEGNATQRKRNAGDLATRDESIDVRAEVLERHRKEWAELEGFRKVALATMKKAHDAGDKETWQLAKIAADTAKQNLSALETKQNGERRAWGLGETESSSDASAKITRIERVIVGA